MGNNRDISIILKPVNNQPLVGFPAMVDSLECGEDKKKVSLYYELFKSWIPPILRKTPNPPSQQHAKMHIWQQKPSNIFKGYAGLNISIQTLIKSENLQHVTHPRCLIDVSVFRCREHNNKSLYLMAEWNADSENEVRAKGASNR